MPNKVLFTDTWLLVIPQLVWYYPGRTMGLLAHVTNPPDTSMVASKGVSSTGNATLAFYLAENATDDLLSDTSSSSLDDPELAQLIGSVHSQLFEPMQNLDAGSLSGFNVSGLYNARRELGARGKHLFTLNVGGELVAKEIKIEEDLPQRPGSWRLRVLMELVKDSLSISVGESDIGTINEDRLRTLMTVAAFLVEAKINDEILKDGFPLPDVPHVKVVAPGVEVVDYALSMDSSVQYVP